MSRASWSESDSCFDAATGLYCGKADRVESSAAAYDTEAPLSPKLIGVRSGTLKHLSRKVTGERMARPTRNTCRMSYTSRLSRPTSPNLRL
ncbi:hypothetical protein MHIP_11910 [Mycolicibacterium hippocampi]|uniref:Uncharacterized protein n=1 Tax=Mycolicibacterium hippocampi TaxID=659824 RepID=A0A7I9ZJB3_9MYCO|nr:hypothetical protein MHIP_11910 [Mycolicibacterium hippocampi]